MRKLLGSILAAVLILAMLTPMSALAAPDSEHIHEPDDAAVSADIHLWKEWGFDSLEEFLEWAEMDEEEYAEMEREQREWEQRYEADRKAWEKQRRAERLLIIEKLGGTPGIVNVMVDGRFTKFTGAVPEISNGLAYAPVRPLFAAMGAAFSYNASTKTITGTRNGISVSFTSGRTTMDAVIDGEKKEHVIKAPYSRNGVTYIPIRDAAEAFGYDIYWDNQFRTVVLIDKAKLITEIDKDFTVVNNLLAMPMSQYGNDGRTYRTVLNLLLSMTQFDSLDGDTNLKMGANVTILSDGHNFSLTGRIDIADYINLLLVEMSYYLDDEELEEVYEELLGIYQILKNITVEMIFNYDEDVLYIKTPLLSEIFPDFSNETWLAIKGARELADILDFGGMTGEDGEDSLFGGNTVGAIIYADSYYQQYYEQIYLYDELLYNAKTAKVYLGDDKFTQRGGDYVLTLTIDDLRAEMADDFAYMGILAFDLTLTVRTRGGEITGISGEFRIREGRYYTSMYATQYTGKFDIKPDKISFTIEIHERNTSKMLIELDISTTETSQRVPKAPPAGAVIVNIEDLFEDYPGFDPDPVIML